MAKNKSGNDDFDILFLSRWGKGGGVGPSAPHPLPLATPVIPPVYYIVFYSIHSLIRTTRGGIRVLGRSVDEAVNEVLRCCAAAGLLQNVHWNLISTHTITQPANANTLTYKKLSYCWETVRRESMPRIAERDVEMTTYAE